jgi:hypothetical protein
MALARAVAPFHDLLEKTVFQVHDLLLATLLILLLSVPIGSRPDRRWIVAGSCVSLSTGSEAASNSVINVNGALSPPIHITISTTN